VTRRFPARSLRAAAGSACRAIERLGARAPFCLAVGGTPTRMGADAQTATTVAVPATAKRGDG